jgi:carbonic anhydrase
MKRVLLLASFVSAVVAAENAGPVWSHSPEAHGPAAWGSAAPRFATCGTQSGDARVEVGMKQSPIDIVTSAVVKQNLPDLVFLYEDTPLDVENTGHVIEVPYVGGSKVLFGRPAGSLQGASVTDEYKLIQFHFHAPSEHTINGKVADMELHLVHQNALGDLAVVGVLMNKGSDPNPAFDQIMGNASNSEGTHHVEGAKINARNLLPANAAYYTYSGSLTTPPCTEGVRWSVLRDPVTVSTYAVNQFHGLISQFPGHDGKQANNNRPTLDPHGRTVLTSVR